jgi:hypothetical protein
MSLSVDPCFIPDSTGQILMITGLGGGEGMDIPVNTIRLIMHETQIKFYEFLLKTVIHIKHWYTA